MSNYRSEQVTLTQKLEILIYLLKSLVPYLRGAGILSFTLN